MVKQLAKAIEPMKPFARINLSSALSSVALAKGDVLRRLFLVSSLAFAVGGCSSICRVDDPNAVFAVVGDFNGDFMLCRPQGPSKHVCVSSTGKRSPSGRFSAVIVCDNLDISPECDVDIVAFAEDGTATDSLRVVNNKDIRGIEPYWFRTFAGDMLVFYVQNDTHASSLFAVRPAVYGGRVSAQLLYFSAPSFVENYYDHRYVDENSIKVSFDGILTYTMWCSSQDGKSERTYNVSVPLAFTWGDCREQTERSNP